VALLLAVSAAVAGGTAGFGLGVAWAVLPLPAMGPTAAAGVAAAAVAGDVAWRRWRSPRPWSVNRQVPAAWSRLFGVRGAAVLYGGRLGVGPLTVLNTWLWWVGAVVAASLGPGPSAAVGAGFGAVRAGVIVVVARRAAPAMSAAMARLQAREPAVARLALLSTLTVGIGVVALAAGCSDDDGRAADPRPPSTTAEEGLPTSTSAPATTIATVPLDAELAAALLAEPPAGFELVDEAGAAGPLDLDAASRAERDPQAERSVLETRGFERGHTRRWANADADVVVATVYQFADDGGAAAYLTDGMLTLEGFGAERFDVPAVPGAAGFTAVEGGGESPRVVHGVAFAAGRRFFLVLRSSERSATTPDDVRALARAQADLVGA
jgi:hypothetical protein